MTLIVFLVASRKHLVNAMMVSTKFSYTAAELASYGYTNGDTFYIRVHTFDPQNAEGIRLIYYYPGILQINHLL
jgi:hypothetical protein